MLMELKRDNETITLNEMEQSEVYEFYRLHCTMDRLIDILTERNETKQFKTDGSLAFVAHRVLGLIDEYHVSENDAIDTIFNEESFIETFTTDITD